MFTWQAGNVYKGNYFDDVRHGFGEMCWNDGSWYKGQWEKGIQHGEGTALLIQAKSSSHQAQCVEDSSRITCSSNRSLEKRTQRVERRARPR